jgi:hypothetical protein
MKPTVHYRGEAKRLGDRALLFPVDHPNHCQGHGVSNTKRATTSVVLSWVAGRIETQNTIYVPIGK